MILGIKFDVVVVLRSQFFEFLRETLYKHALEHLEEAGPAKKMVIDVIVVLRSQFFDFLRETLYKHALEHLEEAGPAKKNHFFSSSSKCPSIIDSFEGL